MKNFTFSKKWYEILKDYPQEVLGAIYAAVLEYAFTGVVVEMEPIVHMAFDFIKHDIDERARRRETRAAKKAKPSTSTSAKIQNSQVQNSTHPKPQKPLTEKEIIFKYYRTAKVPEPVRMFSGGTAHVFSEERIHTLVEVAVKDMLESGTYKPETPEFFNRLNELVIARYDTVRNEMKRYAHLEGINEYCWMDMFAVARQNHAA